MQAVAAISILFALLGAGAADAAPDSHWDSYANTRFNYGVCYPKTLKGRGEATNRDGQVFEGRDGAVLTVFGANVEIGTPLDDNLADDVAELAGTGARVSYRAQKAHWLAASGVGPKGEFYLKRFKRGDQMLTFQFIYPARLHAAYAPVTARMSRCFTIGTDEGD
jgi:hypothetical protein